MVLVEVGAKTGAGYGRRTLFGLLGATASRSRLEDASSERSSCASLSFVLGRDGDWLHRILFNKP